MPLVVAMFTRTIWQPLACLLVAEVLLLLVVPRLRLFQRDVDACIEAEARARADLERGMLLERMSPEHRAEIGRLEGLVAGASARAGLAGQPDWHGLYDALAAYARLAIAHRTVSLTFTGRSENAAERAADGSDVSRLRSELGTAVDERQRAIESELRMISDAIGYAYETCVAAAAAGRAGEGWRAASSLSGCVPALADLARMRAEETWDGGLFARASSARCVPREIEPRRDARPSTQAGVDLLPERAGAQLFASGDSVRIYPIASRY